MDEKPTDSVIHWHDFLKEDLSAGNPNTSLTKRISKHVEDCIGPIDRVFHEWISDSVHVDIFVVGPTPNRPAFTLVSSGMSSQPMTPSNGFEDSKFAELVITLPAEWAERSVFGTGDACPWPVKLLRDLVRLPHQHNTWLWNGHTVSNGTPPEPYDSSLPFDSSLVTTPLDVPPEFTTLESGLDGPIHFFGVIPLYPDELILKIESGAEVLSEQLRSKGVTENFDPHRESLIPSKVTWFPFGRCIPP